MKTKQGRVIRLIIIIVIGIIGLYVYLSSLGWYYRGLTATMLKAEHGNAIRSVKYQEMGPYLFIDVTIRPNHLSKEEAYHLGLAVIDIIYRYRKETDGTIYVTATNAQTGEVGRFKVVDSVHAQENYINLMIKPVPGEDPYFGYLFERHYDKDKEVFLWKYKDVVVKEEREVLEPILMN